MRKGLCWLVGLILGLGMVSSAYAEQWQILGPRALGMGGAHVAVVNDATAAYWNPAAFGFMGQAEAEEEKEEEGNEHFDRDWGLYVQGGVGVQLQSDIGEEVNDVLNYDFDDLSNKADSGTLGINDLDDAVNLVSEIRDLNKKDLGANAMFNASLSMRVKNMGIGAYLLGEIGADPNVDLNNLGFGTAGSAITNLTILGGSQQNILTSAQRTELINDIAAMPGWGVGNATAYVNSLDQALFNAGAPAGSVSAQDVQAAKDVAQAASDIDASTGGGSLSNNNSNVLFQGAAVFEVPLSYGYAFNDYFALGGNVKFMQARVYYKSIKVFDKDKDDFFKNAYDDYEKSSNFGVDLGALAKLGDFRLGIVGRNLNNPEFDSPSAAIAAGLGDYQLDSQVRAGVAYIPASWLTIAADVDVVKNNTPFAEFDSQNVGGGIELKLLSFLSLRGGAYTNFANSYNNLVYTAGLGFDLWGVNLDVGGAISADNTSIDGNTVPEEARAQVALSFQY